jgi:hypothetical protein
LLNDQKLKNTFGTMGPTKDVADAKGSHLFDVLNNVVVDSQLEPSTTSERTIAYQHIEKLKEKEILLVKV